jgi:hypothetical protein
MDEEFRNHYNIRLNFREYFSILSAIPHRWKLLIRGIGKLKLIENDIVDRLKRDPKQCKYKTSFQNGLTFSAIFSRPSLLKYNILLPPHFCIEPNKSTFHGE